MLNLFTSALLLGIISDAFTDDEVKWCNADREENEKCIRFSQQITLSGLAPSLDCEQGANRQDCMRRIQDKSADLMTLDAGELYVADIHHKLVPIMAERYSNIGDDQHYFSVAIVKKDSTINSLKSLRGKKMCSAGAGTMAGWNVPIGKLLSLNLLPVMDCNFHLKSAAAFFGDSCVPDAMDLKYNSEGDNPAALCALCDKKNCSTEKYRSDNGALKCLSEGGDIAFLKHGTVPLIEENKFLLLCPDGRRKSITAYEQCNWGSVPAQAVVTRASASIDQREKFQNLLEEGVKRSLTLPSEFNIFESSQYNGKDLMFKDGSKGLIKLSFEQQSTENYIGTEYKKILDSLKKCTTSSMRLCVLQVELKKCQTMQSYFKEQALQPAIHCLPQATHFDCILAMHNDRADIGVFDGGDVFFAGKHFNMKSIMSEVYGNETKAYYAVAVVKKKNQNIVLTNLKGVNSCHTGFNRTAGWNIPIGYLLSTKQIRLDGCDPIKSVADFFGKSCVPGIPFDDHYMNLCELCTGTGVRKCTRNFDEPYYGYTGAFRCLVEGGGDVAFIKHTTVPENTDGKSSEAWTEGLKAENFQLLCRDGSHMPISAYKKCHIAKVPSHTIMVAPTKKDKEISAYIDVLTIGQQFFGQKKGTFHLFSSALGQKDLIFKDGTTSLQVISKDKRDYQNVLGEDYLEAIKGMDCISEAYRLSFCLVLMIFSIVSILRFC